MGGMGVAISGSFQTAGTFRTGPGGVVVFPLRLGGFRAEPLFGYGYSEFEQGGAFKQSSRGIDLGATASYAWPFLRAHSAYVGWYAAYTRTATTISRPNAPDADAKETGGGVGPVLGAEFFVGRAFSLGLENRFVYRWSNGDSGESNLIGLGGEALDHKSLAIVGLIAARVYFWDF